jgi:serine/threonine protein kinase
VDGDIDSSRSVSLFQWKRIKVSSSEEEDERSRSKQKSSTKPQNFGVLLAQLHFILSILSKDSSYLRLPTSRNLQRCALIGSGCSFNVHRASQKEIPELKKLSDPYFVIKTANITNERDATARMRDILREVQILTHEPLRSHPNVVKLLGFGWEQLRVSTTSKITRWPYLLLEYAGYGSMVDLFEQHIIGLEMRMNICLDVGSGLEALHAADIVHGDVKLENILIFPSTDGRLTAKISDFGFAEVDLDGSQPHVSFRRGTLPWKAPEADRELAWKDLFLTDVYSYGFLIWRTIAYGHRPFVEAGGFVSKEIFEKLEEQKLVDGGILSMACGSVRMVLPAHDKPRIEKALTNSLQRQPPLRDLRAIISALGYVSRFLFFVRMIDIAIGAS